ncbi:MAG: DUF364 domain-containing protein [Firmicutes bacterium]|nr:DUF364 domain-containing protein [Bacillota bacterium]
MNCKILDGLISSIEGDAPVSKVCIGPFWTAVKSRGCGLASTLFIHEHGGHSPVRDCGILTEKTGLELCSYCKSSSILEATIGIAAINSMLDIDDGCLTEINASEILLEKGAGKNVAIVGHFPFVPRLRQVAGNLWVIEKRPKAGDLPEEAAEEMIPKADIIAITGSALTNGTMGHLLELCPKDSLVMVLGPSTPISPVWFDYGVDLISGTVVTDPEVVFRFVSQGTIFRQLSKHGVRLVTMSRN